MGLMSHTIAMGAPRMQPAQTPYIMTASVTSRRSIQRRRAMGAKNDAGSNLERMELTTHVGTHIDSLGHFTQGDRMHGGYSAELTVDDFGLLNLGIENCPPMITRGIVLDVSKIDGGEHLNHNRGERNMVNALPRRFERENARRVVELLSDELADTLALPKDVVLNGLGAGAFALGSWVEIVWPDGSIAKFQHAFACRSRENGLIGIFTEHCGYFVCVAESVRSIHANTGVVFDNPNA